MNATRPEGADLPSTRGAHGLFRVAAVRSFGRNLARTFAQCVVVWGTTLLLGPLLILTVQAAWDIPGFDFPGRRLAGALGFLACSALNLWTGWTLALLGEGTPLPLDCPRRLVIAGPYRWVRNPMALAGIGQGAMVGLWLGSWLVLAYALAGAVLWHVVIRPTEERDLLARFGDAYAAYRAVVPLWIPRARSSSTQ